MTPGCSAWIAFKHAGRQLATIEQYELLDEHDRVFWEAAASAVRKAVLEEAIEAANKIGNEFSEKSERAEIEDDAHYYDAVSVGAKRVFAALQRLVDEAPRPKNSPHEGDKKKAAQ
jgi:hypothetical protein